MNLMRETWQAYVDPLNNGPGQTITQVQLTVAALVLAALIGVAMGVIAARSGRLAGYLVVLAGNLGRTVPTFAVMALVVAISSVGFWPAVIGLVLLGIPPILVNTYTGIREVPASTLDAARGMGLTERQVLARVQAPLALPLVFAGLRTSAVQVVATATLAGLVGAGGLGTLVLAGLGNDQVPVLLAGAIPVAILALLFEAAFAGAERLFTPRGLRITRGGL
jgi:osmoprotectant transport system permease protein